VYAQKNLGGRLTTPTSQTFKLSLLIPALGTFKEIRFLFHTPHQILSIWMIGKGCIAIDELVMVTSMHFEN